MTSALAPEATLPESTRPSRSRSDRSWWPFAAAAASFAAIAPGCLWTATHAHPTGIGHDAALFAHLASLVVGFGAVLGVDWVALLWATGRRELCDVLTAAGNVQVPIWLGYAGLVLSGLFLEPDTARGLTQVKLGLVLLIGWNGLVATWLHPQLVRSPRPSLLAASALCATVSQCGWWGALVIGHLNAH